MVASYLHVSGLRESEIVELRVLSLKIWWKPCVCGLGFELCFDKMFLLFKVRERLRQAVDKNNALEAELEETREKVNNNSDNY